MVLDCHTHIFPAEVRDRREGFFEGEENFRLLYADSRARLVGARELVSYLDEQGIRAACAFGFPWNDTDLARRNNDYVLEAASRFPGRILPFACVHPGTGPAAVREAERCLRAGARGVGEIATYGEGLGPSVRDSVGALAELCRDAGVPLLLHTNEPVGHTYPGKSRMELSEVYELVRAHRETCWILAHWGGGLFVYYLLKKEAEEALKNVHFDTSAGPYLYKPEVYRRFLDIAGPTRLVFGSDYPLLGLSRYCQDMDEAGLAEPERAALLGGNLARLLGLGEAP